MKRHWWYRGRTVAVASLLRRARVQPVGNVLDFGCGTGHMGAVLSRFGPVTGVEGCADAVSWGDFDAYESVHLASSLDAPEFPQGRYGLVALLDVLEHVEDDVALLSGLAGHLGPDGAIVVSVPMDPAIFCAVDEQVGHVRRYTHEALESLAQASGLEIVAITGYVVALLPVARWQRRRVMAGTAQVQDEMHVPLFPVNAALTVLAATEGLLARWFELPQGLSLIAVMRPRAAAGSRA